MRIGLRGFLLVAMIVCGAGMARAQISGCVNSPENPTAVLLMVGAAAAAWPQARAKLKGLRER